MLLGIFRGLDSAPQPHSIPQPPKNSQEHLPPQSPQLPSTDFNFEQPSLQPHSPQKDSDFLPALYLTCFGRFEVRRLGQPIPLCSSRSGQSILRYLVVQPGHSATSDAFMALLWPEDEPEVAQPKLHSAISPLRPSLNHAYIIN